MDTAELNDTFGREGSAESVAAALRNDTASEKRDNLSVQEPLGSAAMGLQGLQHHM